MTDDTKIYEEILRLKREGGPSALAILVQCTGSSPQKAGAKMLVRSDGSIVGTIGGGGLEAEVIQASLAAITSRSCQTIDLELSEEYDYACGGRVLVYIEPISPEPHLIIFGAGHVAKALSLLAKFSGFRVTVADDRPEFANNENLPDADHVLVGDFERVFSQISVDRNTYIVIATRGHRHDLEVLKDALRTEAYYIGLVGSKRKREVLFKLLEKNGLTREDIQRVLVPVGLPIGSVSPQEIAVSIMAQIIQYRRMHGPSRVSDSACSRSVPEDGAT